MFMKRTIKFLPAILLTLPSLLISNVCLAADSLFQAQSVNAVLAGAEYIDIYSSFTAQNAVANANLWLLSITLLLGFGMALLFWIRPKQFTSKDEWQKYYDIYRLRVI